MKKYICEKLKIEEQFRRLVYPLDQRSLAQLETDILSGRRGHLFPQMMPVQRNLDVPPPRSSCGLLSKTYPPMTLTQK